MPPRVHPFAIFRIRTQIQFIQINANSCPIDLFSTRQNRWHICNYPFMPTIPKKMIVLTYRWQMEYQNLSLCKNGNAQYNDNDNVEHLTPVDHKISANSIYKHCLILPIKTVNLWWKLLIQKCGKHVFQQ